MKLFSKISCRQFEDYEVFYIVFHIVLRASTTSEKAFCIL